MNFIYFSTHEGSYIAQDTSHRVDIESLAKSTFCNQSRVPRRSEPSRKLQFVLKTMKVLEFEVKLNFCLVLVTWEGYQKWFYSPRSPFVQYNLAKCRIVFVRKKNTPRSINTSSKNAVFEIFKLKNEKQFSCNFCSLPIKTIYTLSLLNTS